MRSFLEPGVHLQLDRFGLGLGDGPRVFAVDETVATFTDLLRDQKGPLAEQLKWSTVLKSEVERDTSKDRWDGEKFRIGLILSPQQGGGGITETGTLNPTQLLDKNKARVDSAIMHIPISFSTKLLEATDNRDNTWLDAVAGKMDLAEKAFDRIINEQMCGLGDALIAAITGAANSATQTVGTTANFYQLYAGRVVDVLLRSDGTVLSAGMKILSNDPVAGTVTFTAIVNVPGALHGIYIQGTYGNAMQGILQMGGTTGVFESVDRALVAQWKGTDVSPAANEDPRLVHLDKAEREVRRIAGGDGPKFYIGDPAVIDKFTQGLTVQARWAGDSGELDTGWKGVKYKGKLLIPEFDMASQTIVGAAVEDYRMLVLDSGPDWDEKDGSMLKRFSRALPLEAWLIWMVQFAAERCNSTVVLKKMNQAQ